MRKPATDPRRSVGLVLTTSLLLMPMPQSLGEEPGPGVSDPAAVFERLKTLAGRWQGRGGAKGQEEVSVVHEFWVAAGDSVVVEIMDPEGEREVNVYHLSDDDLMMTHYCGGGTQPVLRLRRETTDTDLLSFVLTGGTGFDPATDRHIHTSGILFRQDSLIESRWTAEQAGRLVMESRFVLERMRSPESHPDEDPVSQQ